LRLAWLLFAHPAFWVFRPTVDKCEVFIRFYRPAAYCEVKSLPAMPPDGLMRRRELSHVTIASLISFFHIFLYLFIYILFLFFCHFVIKKEKRKKT